MTHILQMYSDVACTAWNFKFASAMFTTSTTVFFLPWTKNRSRSFSISLKQSILLKRYIDLQISSKQQKNIYEAFLVCLREDSPRRSFAENIIYLHTYINYLDVT